MHSIWTKTAPEKRFPPLEGDRKTEVLIVGGGLAGLLCAYRLRRAGVRCLLLESGHLCGGTTQNTTAKITFQHGLLYDGLLRRLGERRARLYLEAHRKACEEYAALCRGIDAEYERRDSYVYSRTDRAGLEAEVAALKRLGVSARLCEATELPFEVAGAVRVCDQAQFHPLKFAYAIAQEVEICENTRVNTIARHRAVTDRGVITCEKTIVATHFPILNRHGLYPLKLYQHRSYVLALEGAEPVRGMYVDASDKGFSLRSRGDLLLLGGGAHRTGKAGGGWREVEDFARLYYPNARVVARTAAQDCMTLDGVSYIGQYSACTPDLYVTTGFNKWGMSSAMVGAMLLTDLICGRENEYACVFSPSRSILHPQLFVNAGESVLGLVTPGAPRCSHLGCALHYNAAEHSWDCACHGSRFSDSGELLNNPATDGVKLRSKERCEK